MFLFAENSFAKNFPYSHTDYSIVHKMMVSFNI